MSTPTVTGRGWAYAGAILGGVVSIAANVAHSYVPPSGAPAGWTPEPGAVVSAIFWPAALFVAIEILARVAWPTGGRWTALRYLGLLPVAVVAAVVSYRHLSGLLDFYGEDPLTVAIGPLAVDELMVMATGALIATGAHRTAKRITTLAPVVAEDAPAPAAIAVVEPEPVDPAAHVTPEPTPDPATEPTPKRATPAAVKRAPKRQPSAAERVARAAARTPNATPAQNRRPPQALRAHRPAAHAQADPGCRQRVDTGRADPQGGVMLPAADLARLRAALADLVAWAEERLLDDSFDRQRFAEHLTDRIDALSRDYTPNDPR